MADNKEFITFTTPLSTVSVDIKSPVVSRIICMIAGLSHLQLLRAVSGTEMNAKETVMKACLSIALQYLAVLPASPEELAAFIVDETAKTRDMFTAMKNLSPEELAAAVAEARDFTENTHELLAEGEMLARGVGGQSSRQSNMGAQDACDLRYIVPSDGKVH